MLNQKKLQDLTLTAVLAALVLLMSFTPLGYLRVGAVSITFLTIPVAIGAMVVGPSAGLFLGTLFGVTSLIQAIMGDPVGQLLLGANPFLTGCLCIIPRALMGLLTGILFKLYVQWIRGEKIVPMIAGGATASLLNTILFVGGFIGFYLIYRNHEEFGSFSVWGIILSVLTLNALIELWAGIVVSASVSRALVQFLPGGRTHGAERDEWYADTEEPATDPATEEKTADETPDEKEEKND
ncbi:MAG: ECF transporter S component [Clostridia bacterium]|nr:ECF transporter S component [Clostridia bacterium]